jgi:predicted GNAT family acetyltransferase
MELSGAQDTSQPREEEARGAATLVACGDAFLLEAGGRVVSLCTHNARISDMVQVGSVWTPPELRGRGHARAVVAGALLAAGARRAVLFTGEGNIPAQQAYRALGFERVGDYGVVRFAG